MNWISRVLSMIGILSLGACGSALNPKPITLGYVGNVVPTLAVLSGDAQSVATTQVFPLLLWVELSDSNGVVYSNIPISWSVASGSGTLSTTTSLTNADGQAWVELTAGASSGALVVQAEISSTTLVATFNETVL